MTDTAITTAVHDFAEAVRTRLAALEEQAAAGAFDAAIDLITDAIRAGGLIPTKKVALRDLVLLGDMSLAEMRGANLERDPDVADTLFAIAKVGPHDVVLIASNSGVNGSIVGFALAAKRNGNPVIAVTSIDHTMQVQPKHPSGQRLKDVADVVIDNLAPFGDAAITIGADVPVGAVSSITAAFIAQVLTIGVAERFVAAGEDAPLYLSANIPGGDEHNIALEERFGISRFA